MGYTMTSDSTTLDDLLRRAANGDQDALAELFAHYRGRLKRMVQLRLDRRLQGRIDASDVLQEAYLDLAQRAGEITEKPAMPFFLWLRLLTGQRLLAIHRRHFGTRMRDVGQEVALRHGAMPQATSASLAAQLLGRLTSPSLAAVRAEMQLRLQEALNSMDSDRSRGAGAAALRGVEQRRDGEPSWRSRRRRRAIATCVP